MTATTNTPPEIADAASRGLPPVPEQTCALPDPPARVHFVGVGGAGMSGLARILHAWGYDVSGSDAVASALTAALVDEGIAVAVGHADTARAGAADLLVVTAAVRGENPEVQAAEAAGIPIVKRAALLGLLADVRHGVAVAGSHGKSTTSGMLVAALRALGADPSYAVGATVSATGTNAAPGTGAAMVVEADEYDHSFLWLHPRVAIVTNVEYDHPDIFPDQDAYDAAFARFVGNITPDGTLVVAADDPGCGRVLARPDVAKPGHLVTFGQAGSPDWLLAGTEGAWHVTPPTGATVPLPLAVPGAHNARNATAALAALAALGHEPAAAAAALGTFTGVGRRFEVLGEAAGVTVVDDYAHHPTEVAATIAAARGRYPGRRLWAAFQPHTYSRTRALLDEFAAALAAADRVLVLEIYAARETDTLGVSAAELAALVPAASVADGPPGAASWLADVVVPGDVVVTLGAGTVTEVGPDLLARLRALEGGSPPTPGAAVEPGGGVAEAPQDEPGGDVADAPSDAPDEAQAGGAPSVPPPPARTRGRGAGRAAGHRGATETVPDYPHLKVLRDSPMSLHTTWRIGGPADRVVRAPTPADLRAAIAWGAAEGWPVSVIGGGSNLLVGDGGIRGLVVLARTPGERADALVAAEDRGDHVVLRVAAQAPLSWVGRYAAERGWAGLDWGVGLPGTIGGATTNNAGAHGTELKDHLAAVTLLDAASGEIREEPASWLEASYRLTRVKNAPRPRPLHVLEATFHLPKGDPQALVALADDHARFRKETQPTGAVAGSTFANPPGDYAGRLLEAAGLKGYRLGGARFSPKHANWVVNADNATAADVRALIAHARAVVADRFGVTLRQEVEEVGEFHDV
ncbi:MAG: UDP-N-acetylmuramate--L-alanine ligase [uncultured Thermomicrobiales bacterium]|uniref:Multifunctional fusion protein n=1 Tax=uncultured Thermomicrobiales bacterium TaxID=1645740 RepID=A0A6J4UCP2_9BACT|nr:MAG: UDP-N-acetylmuramate--L-alanine ligase [uncultured Thermomicrobiales bacterium]